MLDVIKLVYIAHGWHLGLLQDPLLEEPVEAWKHGPVIRSLYRTFRKYGRSPITDRARDDIGPAAGRIVPAFEGDHRQKKLLAAVWHNYRKYSGGEFISLTHQEGSPWQQTWCESPRHGTPLVIDNDMIRQYYEQKARVNFESRQAKEEASLKPTA